MRAISYKHCFYHSQRKQDIIHSQRKQDISLKMLTRVRK